MQIACIGAGYVGWGLLRASHLTQRSSVSTWRWDLLEISPIQWLNRQSAEHKQLLSSHDEVS